MKKFCFLLIFTFSISTLLIANPFFSPDFAGSPSSPVNKESQSELAAEEINSEENQKSGPKPVLVGKTNKKLTVFQGDLREKIAGFFRSWENAQGNEKSKILWGIIGIAFLYGMIHAAGPGHRKTIVFSLYIARKSPWYEPLITGFLLAFLHGACAIILMLIFKGISGSIASNTNAYSIYMEGFSYLLIIIVALFLIIKESLEFIKESKNKNHSENLIQDNQNKENKNASFKDLLPFLISGLYPCPGAILVLILSFTLSILEAGILAVIFMSLGMSIPIIIVAYLAWLGRKGLFSLVKNKEGLIRKLSFSIEVFGYTLLIIFSLYIGMPFFLSLF